MIGATAATVRIEITERDGSVVVIDTAAVNGYLASVKAIAKVLALYREEITAAVGELRRLASWVQVVASLAGAQAEQPAAAPVEVAEACCGGGCS